MSDWLINILVKKGGPSAVRAILLAIVGVIVAHSGFLAHYGVVYDAATNKITLDLNTLNAAILLLLPAVGAAVIKIANHHADVLVTNAVSTVQSTPPPQG